ncbi:MAG: response regulator, partial [Candidatus Nitrosocosmicus sp.]
MIDDNIETANIIKVFLEKDGFHVLIFNNPFSALDYFKGHPKQNSLVISDIRLPGMNGFDLIARMKKIEPNIKVFLVTAFDKDNIYTELEKYDYEIAEIFQKPFSAKKLGKRIRKHLDVGNQKQLQKQRFFDGGKYSFEKSSKDLHLSNNKSKISCNTIVHNKIHKIKINEVVTLLSKSKMGIHYMIIYDDLKLLRTFYSNYTKIQVEKNNEVVLINPFYETVDSVRQILFEDTFMDVQMHEREESLLIIDANEMYYGSSEYYNSFKENTLTNIKESGKRGLSIIHDTGPFHHKSKIKELIDYEQSLPIEFDLPLRRFCLFNNHDFNRLDDQQKQKILDQHEKI